MNPLPPGPFSNGGICNFWHMTEIDCQKLHQSFVKLLNIISTSVRISLMLYGYNKWGIKLVWLQGNIFVQIETT